MLCPWFSIIHRKKNVCPNCIYLLRSSTFFLSRPFSLSSHLPSFLYRENMQTFSETLAQSFHPPWLAYVDIKIKPKPCNGLWFNSKGVIKNVHFHRICNMQCRCAMYAIDIPASQKVQILLTVGKVYTIYCCPKLYMHFYVVWLLQSMSSGHVSWTGNRTFDFQKAFLEMLLNGSDQFAFKELVKTSKTFDYSSWVPEFYDEVTWVCVWFLSRRANNGTLSRTKNNRFLWDSRLN